MNTKQKIQEILNQKFGISPEEITDSTRFATDLGLDSLDVIDLIMGVEKEFDISIDDNHINDLKNIKNLVDYVNDLTAPCEHKTYKYIGEDLNVCENCGEVVV